MARNKVVNRNTVKKSGRAARSGGGSGDAFGDFDLGKEINELDLQISELLGEWDKEIDEALPPLGFDDEDEGEKSH